MQRISIAVCFLVLGAMINAGAVDKAFSFTYAPGAGDNVRVDLGAYQLSKYLAECGVNRPEIVTEVKMKLGEGSYYRKRTRDQKNRATLLTVYVDRGHLLHIVTFRNETCSECNGTGTRAKPFDKFSSRIAVQFRCLKCEGKGTIPNEVTERYFSLSTEDFENPEEGRTLFAEKAYANAPPDAEQWVERLASQDPRERLAACEWLDRNYVRIGMFFQDITPMLRKARYYEANEKKKMLVWQFWAGKDLPDERRRGYYRIYADSRNGKIVRKEFTSGN